MRPVALIAANYVRMQWLTVLIMTVYLVGITGVFSMNQQRQEVIFFLRSQPLYVLFIAVMLAIPAIQTDRKSRRLLAVLSKGIYRWQYLAGILGGCGIMTGYFSLLIWLIAYSLFVRGGHPTAELSLLAAALFTSCMAASSAGLLYSTFLHPLLATGAAAVTLLLPYSPEGIKSNLLKPFFPVAWMLDTFVHYQFGVHAGLWTIIVAALIWTAVFWAVGAATFARRDVTISPE